MTDLRSPADAVALAEACSVAAPGLKVEHYEFASAPAWASRSSAACGSVEELIKNASIAMHRARRRRNRLQVFSEQMSAETSIGWRWRHNLAALARGEFSSLPAEGRTGHRACGRRRGMVARFSQGSIAPADWCRWRRIRLIAELADG
jgi:hypothetical protein